VRADQRADLPARLMQAVCVAMFLRSSDDAPRRGALIVSKASWVGRPFN